MTRTPGSAMPTRATNRNALPSTLRHEIDNEVRPSTVKTWLTTRRLYPHAGDRSSLHAHADNRMRTPCATFILARMRSAHPTRPCREMQSVTPTRSRSRCAHLARAPPRPMQIHIVALDLTGNSVEVVRRHVGCAPISRGTSMWTRRQGVGYERTRGLLRQSFAH